MKLKTIISTLFLAAIINLPLFAKDQSLVNDVFIDIQQDIEDTTPMMDGRFELQTNLILDLATIANFNAKFLILQEEADFPQITATLGVWYFAGLHILPQISYTKGAKNLSVFGAVPSVVASKTLSDDFTFYGGVKLSFGHIQFDLSQVIEDNLAAGSTKDLVKDLAVMNSNYYDPAVFVGSMIQIADKSYLTSCIGFQILSKRVYGKVSLSYESWEFALGIYPDSLIILQPIINIQYRFGS